MPLAPLRMTMDMNIQQRGGLRVEAAGLVLGPNKTASPASSDSSDRTGSPGNNSPSSSPSLLLPLNNNNSTNNNNHGELSKLMTSPSGPGPVGASKGTMKRSFDVAFLMAPDDLSTIKKRHQQQEQQLRLVTTASLMMRSAMTPLNVSVTPPQPAEPVQQQQQALSRHILQQHPPSLMIGPDIWGDEEAVRSAFTKVTTSVTHPGNLLMMQSASPSSMSSSLSAGGMSPQNSLSPSPRTATTPTPTSPPYALGFQPPPHQPGAAPGPGPGPGPAPGPAPGLPYGTAPFFVPPPQQTTPPPPQQDKDRSGKAARRYSPPTVNRNNGTSPSHPFPFGSYPKMSASPGGGGGGPDLMGFQKIRPGAPPGVLYPESLAAYTNLAAAAAAAYPFGGPPASAPVPVSVPVPVPSPGSALAAAAVVSASLLPPTLAALSLPAQNVCAKCNVSFRMTSDLVYHMRAHHKSDHAVNDPSRRRREQDKLKCPVCSESFRERHHLTRHMTAHQDKEGDMAEEAEQPPQEGPAGPHAGASPEGKAPHAHAHAHGHALPHPHAHQSVSRRRGAGGTGTSMPAK